MTKPLLSLQWHRVQALTPHLNEHIETHRHVYRGLIWFILENKATGRHHRFNAAAFKIIGLLDGKRTVNEIWELLNAQLGDFSPTQDEIILLLSQLYCAELLQANVAMDVDDFFQRQQQQKNLKIKQRLSNPLSKKIPLWDPNDFLDRHLSKVSWLFNGTTVLSGMAFIIVALLLAAMHWNELGNHILVNTLSPYNLSLVFLLYPLIKITHELGHAFTAKLEGGEIHELGVIFLMFIPIPYVNVSTVTTFRNKYKRILVGLAGILTELFLAALALFIWLLIEPGILRDIAFNIMLIGGISTVLFNGNPLLKFDGYYVLADALDIPDLFQRSASYWSYLAQRYLFGLKSVESPAYSSGESVWFILYGLLSFCYRMTMLWFIVVYVTDTFFVIGIVMALWLVLTQILLPLMSMLEFIVTSSRLQTKRFKFFSCFSAVFGVLIMTIFIVPLPSYTMAEGIVWSPDDGQLRAESDGFCGPLLMHDDSQIQSGVSIIDLEDPFLKTRVVIQQARLKELQASYRAEQYQNPAKAQLIKLQISPAQAELDLAQKQMQSMHVKSAATGQLLIPNAEDLPGQFIKQGALIGYILTTTLPVVRTLVSQADIGKLQPGRDLVQIRLANRVEKILRAKIIRVVPQATNRLPSAALATTAGGKMILDPAGRDDLLTVEPFFLVDVEFSPLESSPLLGVRTYVRFTHAPTTLARQLYRNLRQLFLRQFNV